MKVSFFAAALLGVISMDQVHAVNLNNLDYVDYEFAEIDSNTLGEGKTDTNVEAKADVDADAAADATADACEQQVGGVTIRLNTPEC